MGAGDTQFAALKKVLGVITLQGDRRYICNQILPMMLTPVMTCTFLVILNRAHAKMLCLCRLHANVEQHTSCWCVDALVLAYQSRNGSAVASYKQIPPIQVHSDSSILPEGGCRNNLQTCIMARPGLQMN